MAPSRGKRSFNTILEEDGSSIETGSPRGRKRQTIAPAQPRRSARIAKKLQETELKAPSLQYSGVTKTSNKQPRVTTTQKISRQSTAGPRRKIKKGSQGVRRRIVYPTPPLSTSYADDAEPERFSLSIALQPSSVCEPGTPLYPPLTVLLHPQQPPAVSFDLQTAQLWGMVTLLDSSGEIIAPPSPTKLSGKMVDSPHILEPQPETQPENLGTVEAEHGGPEGVGRRRIAEEAYLMFPNLSISEVGDYSLLVSLMEMDPVVLGGARKVTDIQSRPISVRHVGGGGSGSADEAGNASVDDRLKRRKGTEISGQDRAQMERLRKMGVEMDMEGLVYH